MDFGKGGERTPLNEQQVVGVVEKNDVRGVLSGLLENVDDAAPVVLTIAESDDNDQTDKYGGEIATGTITFDGGANPSDTEQIAIDDGVTSLVFEFDNNAAITGDVTVTIGGSAAATLAALKTAIEGTALDVTVEDTTGSGDPQLTLTVNTPSDASNNTITTTGANITVTGLAGGSDINDITFRSGGADVASLTVQPRGVGEFVIEDAKALKRFLRFRVDARERHVRLTLKYASGRLVRRDSIGVP
jgi:hypothetical protein